MGNIASQKDLHANQHAVHISSRMEIARNGVVTRVLVVQTDLELNGLRTSYDEAAVQKLADAVAKALGEQFDRGDIVPITG